MEYKDYYKILGVNKDASQDEIKKSYRKLAKKYHPDSNKDKDAENKFKEISEAFNVLNDKDKKAKYDAVGSSYNRFKTTGGNNTDFWDEWLKKNTNNNSKTKNTAKTAKDFFNEGGTMSDFFERIFGSTSTKGTNFNTTTTKKNKPKPTKGKNYETSITLTLQEAFNGTSRILNIDEQKIEVKFKEGIENGHIQKISGKGYPSINGGKNGDLIINVKIANDNKIKRKGNDLYTRVNCDLYTTILGGNVIVTTFFGSFNIKIPPLTQNEKIFKLSKQGMPIYNTKEKGDLYVTLSVILPQNISEEEKEHFVILDKLKIKE
jgi:curved DNA-binding protein